MAAQSDVTPGNPSGFSEIFYAVNVINAITTTHGAALDFNHQHGGFSVPVS